MKTILFSLVFIYVNIFAQIDVEKEINRILSDQISNKEYSVFIYDPLTSDTIYAKDIYAELIPASNIKLYTTAAALNLLSTETELTTKFFVGEEDFSDSVLNGNLFIKGFGDALLTESDLDSVAEFISKRNIKKIDGDIIADESYFDKIYTRDDWIQDEKANVSLPPISGLSMDRNSVVIRFDRDKKIGDPPGYNLIPSGSFYDVIMNARLTKFRSRPKISFRTGDEKIKIIVGGGIQQRRFPYSYIIYPDSPAVFVAMVFRDKLQQNGIEISGKVKSGITDVESFYFTELNHQLADLITDVNKKSDNYLAENLFKILGAEFSLKEGNSFYATQAVMTFLDDNNIYSEGTSIVDGSGISRFNSTTTASIVSLLEYMYLDLARFDFYYNSLSIAGRDGTLEDRLYESAAYKNFRGKTGTLYGVTSISGYLTTKSNRDLIISIIMNDKSQNPNYMRKLQDKIISWCAENL